MSPADGGSRRDGLAPFHLVLEGHFSRLRRVVPAANALDVDRRRRQLHAQRLQGLYDDVRDRQISNPFVVRRNHEPGRVRRARLLEHIFVGRQVFGPELCARYSQLR